MSDHAQTGLSATVPENGTPDGVLPDNAFALLEAALVDAVVLLDAQGCFRYASDRLRRVLGYDRGALVGKRLIDFVHENDRRVLPDGAWWRLIPADREFRMRGADERYHWVSVATSAATLDGERRQVLEETLGGGSLLLIRDVAQGDIVRDRVDLYRRALNAVNNLVVLSDPREDDNPLVFANDHFLRKTGYRSEEVIGRNCRFLQRRPDGTQDDQPEERAQIRHALASGTETDVVVRNYRKDGTLFYNHLFLNPIYAEGGALVGFVGVQNDVTELLESREAAEYQGRLLEAFFESAPFAMGVIELTEEGHMRHLMGNAVARRLHTIDGSGPLTGLYSSELGFTPEEDERWREAIQACRTSGAPVRFSTAFPWGSDASDGDARHLDIVVNAADDEAPLFSYVSEDITDRRHSEREREMLQQAVASSPQGMLITRAPLARPGPEIVYVNEAYGRITGYTPEELVGQNPRLMQGPKTDRATLDRLRRQLEAGEHFEGEAVNYRKDGSEFILHWAIAPIYDETGAITHWTSSHRDVTEQRRLEQEVLDVVVREQERIARDLHDGLGQTIAAAAMLCATSLDDLQEEMHPQAGVTSRIHDLLRDAVRQARSLAHGLHPVNVKVDGLMKALAHLTETASAAYGVDCTFVCEEPVMMEGHDRSLHLYRIVQEAISNAVRHGQARAITVTLDVSAGDVPGVPDRFVALSVQDDGRGVSGEAFLQSDGLGLRSMQYRAERLGGQFSIRSLEQGGTLVRVLFDPKDSTNLRL